jgi:hypothetical protein
MHLYEYRSAKQPAASVVKLVTQTHLRLGEGARVGRGPDWQDFYEKQD